MRTKLLPKVRLPDVESILQETPLALLFLSPAVLVLAVLVGWSLLYAFFLSFHELVIESGDVHYLFVGLKNYLRFARDLRLHQVLIQTLVYCAVRVTGVVVIGLGMAKLLDQPIRGIQLLRPLLLIPWALSFVVNALVWGWIYHGNYGALNAILLKLHLIRDYHVWLAEPGEAMPAIIFAEVWKAVPFAALIFHSALQGVVRDLKDAARVDGAGNWGVFLHVTLPALKPVILVVLVLQSMWALKTFDLVRVLTQGGPLDKTMMLNIYAYQQTFEFFKFGYGAALAYLITFLILMLTWLYFKVLRGFEE